MMWETLFKYILRYNIPANKAASLVFGLLAVMIFYLTRQRHGILETIKAEYGSAGVAIAFALLFLLVFFLTQLIGRVIIGRMNSRSARRMAAFRETQRQAAMANAVKSLSPWQMGFLRRFVDEGRSQIPEWKVGQFRAVWGPEVEVLIRKGIVLNHRNVYEVVPEYRQYLQDSLEQLNEEP